MQLIDQHGRLFGRVNLIDAMAVAFLLSLTPMVYVGYRITAGRRDAAVSRGPAIGSTVIPAPKWEFVNVEAVMTVEDPTTYIQLRPGLESEVKSEFPEIVVIAMRWYDPGPPGSDAIHPHPDTLNVPQWPKRVLMRFRVPCQYRGRILVYAGGPLQLGGPFTFKVQAFTLSGAVTDLAAARWMMPAP